MNRTQSPYQEANFPIVETEHWGNESVNVIFRYRVGKREKGVMECAQGIALARIVTAGSCLRGGI